MGTRASSGDRYACHCLYGEPSKRRQSLAFRVLGRVTKYSMLSSKYPRGMVCNRPCPVIDPRRAAMDHCAARGSACTQSPLLRRPSGLASRVTNPSILEVPAVEMAAAWDRVYGSAKGVWLSECVPPESLTVATDLVPADPRVTQTGSSTDCRGSIKA